MINLSAGVTQLVIFRDLRSLTRSDIPCGFYLKISGAFKLNIAFNQLIKRGIRMCMVKLDNVKTCQ